MPEKKNTSKPAVKSCALKRKTQFYPEPKIRECILGEVALSEGDLSQSAVVARIVKEYYNSLPPARIEYLRRVSKNQY